MSIYDMDGLEKNGLSDYIHPFHRTLSIGDFAEIVGMSRSTINRKMKNGELKPYKNDRGHKYFKYSDALYYQNKQQGDVLFSFSELQLLFDALRDIKNGVFDIQDYLTKLENYLIIFEIQPDSGIAPRVKLQRKLKSLYIRELLLTLRYVFSNVRCTETSNQFDSLLSILGLHPSDDDIENIKKRLDTENINIGLAIVEQLLDYRIFNLLDSTLHEWLMIIFKCLIFYDEKNQIVAYSKTRFLYYLNLDIQFIIASYLGVK